MEKSIESIWKEGFLKGDALVAPKVNNLYDRKSSDLIDKLKRMFALNFWYLVGLAIFFLAVGIFSGFPLVGAGWAFLLVILLFASKSESDKMEILDKGVSSYEYLISFKEWLDSAFKRYGRIYLFFYPAFFFFLVMGTWFSKYNEAFMEKILEWNPEVMIFMGIPVFILVGTLIVTALLPFVSGALYRLDVNLAYGRVFKRLDQIIEDVEELRS